MMRSGEWLSLLKVSMTATLASPARCTYGGSGSARVAMWCECRDDLLQVIREPFAIQHVILIVNHGHDCIVAMRSMPRYFVSASLGSC